GRNRLGLPRTSATPPPHPSGVDQLLHARPRQRGPPRQELVHPLALILALRDDHPDAPLLVHPRLPSGQNRTESSAVGSPPGSASLSMASAEAGSAASAAPSGGVPVLQPPPPRSR